jgi:N6-adenosine-specific RNA methylase IME4
MILANDEILPKYNIVYADPPWQYQDRNTGGSYQSGAAQKYQVMSIKDICELPVRDLTAENSVLFIWTTGPMIQEAFEVIKAWGFKYKTVGFVWVKRNRKSPGWFWGCGHWTRANSEICLLAVKGNPKRINASVHQIVELPIQEHSKKPDKVREKIVDLMGDLPRIELFARQKYPGWDAWGNEIKSDIDLKGDQIKNEYQNQ